MCVCVCVCVCVRVCVCVCVIPARIRQQSASQSYWNPRAREHFATFFHDPLIFGEQLLNFVRKVRARCAPGTITHTHTHTCTHTCTHAYANTRTNSLFLTRTHTHFLLTRTHRSTAQSTPAISLTHAYLFHLHIKPHIPTHTHKPTTLTNICLVNANI